MKYLFVAFVIAAGIAAIDLYNQPESMTGCYEIDFPGWETGRYVERFRVTSLGHGEYELNDFGKKPSDTRIPMKKASADDLREVGRAFKFLAEEGVSIKWKQGAPNPKPIGIYRGTDQQGKEIILAFFFFSNGLAKEISCSSATAQRQNALTRKGENGITEGAAGSSSAPKPVPVTPREERFAGTVWAMDKNLVREEECTEGSVEFINGCKAYVRKRINH